MNIDMKRKFAKKSLKISNIIMETNIAFMKRFA